MNTSSSTDAGSNLTVATVLAQLLERLEHSSVPVGAEQYRSVVLHLASEFTGAQPDRALGALLDAHPAAAELYENLRYQHAGLCRSPLDLSMSAELQARDVVERARRSAKAGPYHGQA